MTGDGSPSLLASALTGATLTLSADLLGQFAFSTKFPVGVITGIIGAPYLLFLLVKINRSGGSV
jgi:iron complex transport system permease protein